MDNSSKTDNPDEIWCVDSETGKQYIMNIKTGQVVREVTNDKPI